MPTPPRKGAVQDEGQTDPDKQDLLVGLDLLLRARHAELAQQMEQIIEDLLVRLQCDGSSHGIALSHLPTLSAAAISTERYESMLSMKTPATYVRSFTESMLIKKNEADQIAKKATEREQAFRKLSSAEIDRTQTPKKRAGRRIDYRSTLKSFVQSSLFESISTLFIVSNALFFGIETEFMANDLHIDVFDGITMVFTVVFLVELVMRVSADPRQFFCSNQKLWNAADTIVVAVSLVELFFQVSKLNSNINLSHIRIIRTARTVRIFRVIRILKAFSSLRILLHCVLNTLRSLIWTIFLLTMVLYIFGILFTQASVEFLADNKQSGFNEADQVLMERLDLYYTSLPASMYTLFKAISGGVSWEDVSRPLGFVHPCWELLFVSFISFTYFAVLNVVTGVFCQSAIESAAHDKDMVVQAQMSNKALYTQQLQDLFAQIVKTDCGSQTGSMDFGMLEKCLGDPQCQAYFDALGITASDAWNLFQLLDHDENKELDLAEFVEGCLKLRGSARSIDCHMLLYESHWTMDKVASICNALTDLSDQLAIVLPTLDTQAFERLKSRRMSCGFRERRKNSEEESLDERRYSDGGFFN